MEIPSKGFHRLAPGREIRLRYAYVIKCERVIKDASGGVTELHCTYNPSTRGVRVGDRKVATIHWVSASHAVPIEVRLYDHLFLRNNRLPTTSPLKSTNDRLRSFQPPWQNLP